MYGIREYLDACEYRRDFLLEQLKWLKQEREEFYTEANRIDGVLQRIRQEMVGYLLPQVSDEHLTKLEQKLSYPGLLPIKRDYDGRFEQSEQRRVELEAMDEIQQYDYFHDQAVQGVEEIRPAYEKMAALRAQWESSKNFFKLLKRGYFDLNYQAGLLRRFFDWRDVSFLMSHLQKKADLKFEQPEELREHFRQLKSEADDVFAAFNKRTEERDRITELKAEHEQVLKAPERLLSELFAALGDAVLAHFDACSNDLRLELARNDAHLNAFFRKHVGTEKQIQYLRELSVTRIDSRIQQVDQEIAKTKRKIDKLKMQQRRGKRKRYSRDDLNRMRNVKADKWERKRQKTAKVRQKIAGFQKHDRGSCASDFLWWDLMTGGAMADDLFEVREFRAKRPGWDYRTYEDPTEVGEDDPEELDVLDPLDDAAVDLASSMTAADELFMDPS